MYSVRVDFVNGLHLEYNFKDLHAATACRKALSLATLNGEKSEIWDDAGRTAYLDCAHVQVVTMVVIEEEVVSMIRLGMVIDAVRNRLGVVAPEGVAASPDGVANGRISIQQSIPGPAAQFSG